MLKSNIYLITFWAILLVGYSCSDETPENLEDKTFPKVQTRALNPLVPSISNPTLHNDWESVKTIYLNGGGVIDAPWIMGQGNSMNIPDIFRMDIRKDDNWELLYHTLIDKQSLEPNYILFYNKKRGILKVFYYSFAYENNSGLYWVLESNKATHSLLANTLVQNYDKNKYATTSNCIKYNSITDIGHLNSGWNAFSFEIPYGYSNNSDFTVSMYGFNQEESKIKLDGKFSGIVNIPQVVSKPNKFLSLISSVAKIASTVFTGYGKVVAFLLDSGSPPKFASKGSNYSSAFSKFFGSLSSAFSRGKEIVYIQGTLSGKIHLDGKSISTKSGLIKSINNIPLNKEYIGLWNLRKPTLYSSRYYVVQFPSRSGTPCKVFHKLSCDPDDNSGFLNSKKNKLSLDDYIVVNPSLKNEVESYKVIEASIFNTGAFFPILGVYTDPMGKDKIRSTNYLYDNKKGVFIGDYLLDRRTIDKKSNISERFLYNMYNRKSNLNFDQFKFHLNSDVYRNSFNKFMIAYNTYPRMRSTVAVNIVAQFKFKDSTTFISSRNYPIDIQEREYYSFSSLEKELKTHDILFDPQRENFPWPMSLNDLLSYH